MLYWFHYINSECDPNDIHEVLGSPNILQECPLYMKPLLLEGEVMGDEKQNKKDNWERTLRYLNLGFFTQEKGLGISF